MRCMFPNLAYHAIHDLHSKRKTHRRPQPDGTTARVPSSVLMREDGLFRLHKRHMLRYSAKHNARIHIVLGKEPCDVYANVYQDQGLRSGWGIHDNIMIGEKLVSHDVSHEGDTLTNNNSAPLSCSHTRSTPRSMPRPNIGRSSSTFLKSCMSSTVSKKGDMAFGRTQRPLEITRALNNVIMSLTVSLTRSPLFDQRAWSSVSRCTALPLEPIDGDYRLRSDRYKFQIPIKISCCHTHGS